MDFFVGIVLYRFIYRKNTVDDNNVVKHHLRNRQLSFFNQFFETVTDSEWSQFKVTPGAIITQSSQVIHYCRGLLTTWAVELIFYCVRSFNAPLTFPSGEKSRKQTNEQNGQSGAAERLMCRSVSVSPCVAGELLALCRKPARVSVQTVCDRHSLKKSHVRRKRQLKHTFRPRLSAHPGSRTNALGPTHRNAARF